MPVPFINVGYDPYAMKALEEMYAERLANMAHQRQMELLNAQTMANAMAHSSGQDGGKSKDPVGNKESSPQSKDTGMDWQKSFANFGEGNTSGTQTNQSTKPSDSFYSDNSYSQIEYPSNQYTSNRAEPILGNPYIGMGVSDLWGGNEAYKGMNTNGDSYNQTYIPPQTYQPTYTQDTRYNQYHKPQEQPDGTSYNAEYPNAIINGYLPSNEQFASWGQ